MYIVLHVCIRTSFVSGCSQVTRVVHTEGHEENLSTELKHKKRLER